MNIDVNNQYREYSLPETYIPKRRVKKPAIAKTGHFTTYLSELQNTINSIDVLWYSSNCLYYSASNCMFVIKHDIQSYKHIYEMTNGESINLFFEDNPRFKDIISELNDTMTAEFELTGKPILEAKYDPEYESDLSLKAYFKVPNISPEILDKLFEVRYKVFKSLNNEEKTLLSIFLI